MLLSKPGQPPDSPRAYGPIVLLDDAGNMLVRILAACIGQHLRRVGPGLWDAQFGCRKGRSTIAALLCLRAMVTEAVIGGGVLLAVSLDIGNAYNSLPFSSIREALRYQGLPLYLRRLLAEYLERHSVLYVDRIGHVVRTPMSCVVPQGPVLRPPLLNIAYDSSLRGGLPAGLGVICYADDTLVTARGGQLEEASCLATLGTE